MTRNIRIFFSLFLVFLLVTSCEFDVSRLKWRKAEEKAASSDSMGASGTGSSSSAGSGTTAPGSNPGTDAAPGQGPVQGGGSENPGSAGSGNAGSGPDSSSGSGSDGGTSNTGPATPPDSAPVVPPPAPAPGETRPAASWGDFLGALQNSSVGTINLTGGISTATARPSGDVVLVMGNPDRDTVINGNGMEMSLDYAGIILAGNVTLNNVVLSFRNGVRNCIVANGYTLTLNQVRPGSSSRNSIHLFCGEITNHNSGSLPPAGSHGKIVVQGTNNQLGNIYAGSLDDAPNAGQVANNDFKGAATIIWDKGATGKVGVIYGHGARESRGEGQADVFYNDLSRYICSGPVTVSLGSSRITNFTLDGRTGGATNATFRYVDEGKGYQAGPILSGIGRLELVGSDPQPYLVPAAGSSFAAGASLSLPANTKLSLTSLDANISFDSLEGGGLLVLRENQTVTIAGNVSGKTKIGLGDVNPYLEVSTGSYKLNHFYIAAVQSNNSSFSLMELQSDYRLQLKNNGQGQWSIQ